MDNDTQPIRSFFWPTLLIIVGLIFLLNNYGVVRWNIWGDLWRIWPIILILLGLQILFGRNKVGNRIVSLLGIVILLILLLVLIGQNSQTVGDWLTKNSPGIAQKVLTPSSNLNHYSQTIEQNQYTNVTERNLKTDLGIGTMTISDSEDSYYFRVDADYYGDIAPQTTTNLNNTILSLEYFPPSQQIIFGTIKQQHNLILGLPKLKTDINTTVGTGKESINFNRLLLNNLKAVVGTGETDITLGNTSLPTGTTDLQVGTGSITVHLPKDIGLSVNHKIGVGKIMLDSQSYVGNGIHNSSNYDSSNTKMTVNVTVGTGIITFVRY